MNIYLIIVGETDNADKIYYELYLETLKREELRNAFRRIQMIDILLKYILWDDFLKDLEAQSDFEKKLSQKAGQVEPFLSEECSKKGRKWGLLLS